jgi:hypothetical protein
MFRTKSHACRVALAAAAVPAVLFGAGEARAQFQVTTYQGGRQDLVNFNIADAVFNGARPQRFVGNGTAPQVDLFENGGPGQFTINHPFPGLDKNVAPSDTDDFTARATGVLVVNTMGMFDFFTDSDDGNRFRLDLNRNGTFEDATESIVPDGGLQGTGTPEASMPATASTAPARSSFSAMPLAELPCPARSASARWAPHTAPTSPTSPAPMPCAAAPISC